MAGWWEGRCGMMDLPYGFAQGVIRQLNVGFGQSEER